MHTHSKFGASAVTFQAWRNGNRTAAAEPCYSGCPGWLCWGWRHRPYFSLEELAKAAGALGRRIFPSPALGYKMTMLTLGRSEPEWEHFVSNMHLGHSPIHKPPE